MKKIKIKKKIISTILGDAHMSTTKKQKDVKTFEKIFNSLVGEKMKEQENTIKQLKEQSLNKDSKFQQHMNICPLFIVIDIVNL